MTDAPERIWLDWPAANRGDAVYDEPPERETQPGQTGYIRASLLQDPNTVHLNMLRGTIAKPSVAQILHLYPGIAERIRGAAEIGYLQGAMDVHQNDQPDRMPDFSEAATDYAARLIAALDDPPCTCCDDTGITHQTERFCTCDAGITAALGGASK